MEGFFSILPIEMFDLILEKLDYQSFVNMRSVCQNIKNRVDNSKRFQSNTNLHIKFKIQSQAASKNYNPLKTINSLMSKINNIDCITISNLQYINIHLVGQLNFALAFYQNKLVLSNYYGSTTKLYELLGSLSINQLSMVYDNFNHPNEYIFQDECIENLIASKQSYTMFRMESLFFYNCPTLFQMQLIFKNRNLQNVKNIYIIQKNYGNMKIEQMFSYFFVHYFIDNDLDLESSVKVTKFKKNKIDNYDVDMSFMYVLNKFDEMDEF